MAHSWLDLIVADRLYVQLPLPGPCRLKRHMPGRGVGDRNMVRRQRSRTSPLIAARILSHMVNSIPLLPASRTYSSLAILRRSSVPLLSLSRNALSD
jgi:hypothetical protein